MDGLKNVDVLQQMQDREMIRDLPVRYCQCVWNNDVAGMVDLYTEDGTVTTDFPSEAIIANSDRPLLPITVRGRSELYAMYEREWHAISALPFIHNHWVQLRDATSANGRCHHEVRLTRDGRSWIGAGYYDDEYTKVSGEWKFRSRHYVVRYFVPLSEGWAEQTPKT